MNDFSKDSSTPSGLAYACKLCKHFAYRVWADANPDKIKANNRRPGKSINALVRNRRRKAWVAGIKMRRGCTDCGYNKHPDALEFDHMPGSVKLFPVGGNVTRSRSAVLAEIAKCEVVCANCHRIRTAIRREGMNMLAKGAFGD